MADFDVLADSHAEERTHGSGQLGSLAGVGFGAGMVLEHAVYCLGFEELAVVSKEGLYDLDEDRCRHCEAVATETSFCPPGVGCKTDEIIELLRAFLSGEKSASAKRFTICEVSFGVYRADDSTIDFARINGGLEFGLKSFRHRENREWSDGGV
ncbi:hypothetical protein HG530_014349 [Fusarium avenaceum]|nr:hypothetical protein HG530_014349 [Fusarium avenaceum]